MTDRRLANREAAGDLFILEPLAKQRDDLVLSSGERGDLGCLGAAFHQYWSGHFNARLSLSRGRPHERV